MDRYREPDLASSQFKAEPYRHWSLLRDLAPVHSVRLRNGTLAWLVSRYDDAAAVLGNPQFVKDPLKAKGHGGSKPPWLPGPLRALSRNMLDLDEPDHRRLRNLVQKAFTPRVVEEMRPRIEHIASGLLDAIERRGDNCADLIADYAAPIPVTVIAELLGVAEEDRRKFHRWSNHIVAADTSLWHQLRAIPAGFAFILFLRRLIRQRREALGDDLLSRLIEVQDEGDRLSADELLAMCFLLLVAGHETTVNLIGNGVLALLENPEQMQRLRDEPALIAPAVEEMLRYSSPLQLATERYATTPVTIGEVTIPRGALVYVALASANRDEKAFSCPAEFQPDRQPNRHLAFGHGIHYCLGAPLARLEGQIAIRLLLERFREIYLVPESRDLRWRQGLVLRGVEALPVIVSR
ncbi:MAG TPA: cytochrome P450 [Thermoanaerobaculia bacterium]|nr:cytochrome P450 [Thermoanaerobaculia bacterium]